jgi:hypothetical protein
MARAKQDHARGNIDTPVNFPGDAARIHVSSVGNEARACADFHFFAATGKKRIDISAQAYRIIWIKPACDSGKANHGEPLGLISF